MPNYVVCRLFIITEHTCRAIRLLGAHLYSWSVQSWIPAKLFGIHSGTKSLRPLQFRQRLHSDSETTRGQLQHLTSRRTKSRQKKTNSSRSEKMKTNLLRVRWDNHITICGHLGRHFGVDPSAFPPFFVHNSSCCWVVIPIQYYEQQQLTL